MNLRTTTIPSYELKVFDETRPYFWMSRIEGLSDRYAFLKKPHHLNGYTIFFNESDNGFLQIDQRKIGLVRNHIACVKPNNVVSLQMNAISKGTILCFHESFFSLRYNNNVLYQFEWLKQTAENDIFLSENQLSKCDTILQFMINEMTAETDNSEKIIRSYLNILLFEIDKNFKKTNQLQQLSSSEEKVVQFEKLIDLNYQKQKTPSWYAAELHISVNYLNKLCQSFRNITSGEMIRKRVLIEAKRMLYYTTLSVAEIAYDLGFESVSYFITLFKKNIGVTPEMFRKRNG